MRLLISGTRNDLSDEQKELISTTLDNYNVNVLIHGGCRGVDSFVAELGRKKGWKIIEEKPDWSLGIRAGPIRNKKMIDEHRPDILIAFPVIDSKGTYSCINMARNKGIYTVIVDL